MLRILLTLVFAVAAIKSYSQKVIVTGKYINLNGDTILTNFVLPYNKMGKHLKINLFQKAITIKDSLKNKVTLTPETVKELYFNYNNEFYKFVSVSNDMSGLQDNKLKNTFLREELANDCKVYSFLRQEIKTVPTIQKDYYNMGLNQGDAIIAGSKEILTYTKDVLLYKCGDSNEFKKPKNKNN